LKFWGDTPSSGKIAALFLFWGAVWRDVHFTSALLLISFEADTHTHTHICFMALWTLSGITEWWGAGMVICLMQGADLHMVQLMPLPLTVSCSSKSRLVLPEWFCFSGAGLPTTQVVLAKRPLNECSSSSSTRVSRYQKGKPIWILLKQETLMLITSYQTAIAIFLTVCGDLLMHLLILVA